jgi:hypothetical protein
MLLQLKNIWLILLPKSNSLVTNLPTHKITIGVLLIFYLDEIKNGHIFFNFLLALIFYLLHITHKNSPILL